MKKSIVTPDVTGFPYDIPEEEKVMVDIEATYDPVGDSVAGIKQFILDAGSDSLQTCGGNYEGGIYLQQVPGELAPCLIELLKYKNEIKSYLEIGSAAGGSAYIFNHFFNLNKIVLVDDNKHHWAGLRKGTLKDVNYREIIGRSESEESIRTISDFNMLFDLIMIDGDHSYTNTKLDVTLYLRFLRSGGFLFLHDTVYSPQGNGRVARELKADIGMEFVGEYIAEKGPKLGIALFRKVVA